MPTGVVIGMNKYFYRFWLKSTFGRCPAVLSPPVDLPKMGHYGYSGSQPVFISLNFRIHSL